MCALFCRARSQRAHARLRAHKRAASGLGSFDTEQAAWKRTSEFARQQQRSQEAERRGDIADVQALNRVKW